MSKADNKPYDPSHEDSEKKSSSRRESSSSSSSSVKILHEVRRVLSREERRIDGTPPLSLQDRFESRLGVKYTINYKNLTKAAWYLKRRDVIDSFIEEECTWLSEFWRKLEDLDYEGSKKTVQTLLNRLAKDKIIGRYEWYPKARKLRPRVIYYTYDKLDSFEELLFELERKDIFWFSRQKSKKTPKEIAKHGIEVKKEFEIQGKAYEKEKEEKRKESYKCEHGFGPLKCGNRNCKNKKKPYLSDFSFNL